LGFQGSVIPAQVLAANWSLGGEKNGIVCSLFCIFIIIVIIIIIIISINISIYFVVLLNCLYLNSCVSPFVPFSSPYCCGGGGGM